MKFFLGTHHPHWLARTDVPLFVSRRALERLKSLPRALGSWALDSGGFSELSLNGRWLLSVKDYVAQVRRFQDEIGNLQWAAIQDWMCEPVMVQRTGLTVREHQRRSVASFLELRSLAPEIPWLPVLQGWTCRDYEDHVGEYALAGVDLRSLPIVGVGSVCRRQNTLGAGIILRSLARLGLKLHGFGFKAGGLRSIAETDRALGSPETLASADSLAWSYHARREPPRPDCRGKHINCANCLPFALEWRSDLLARLESDARRDTQRLFFSESVT